MDIIPFGTSGRIAERDKEKKLICKENGITLIEVPYWWDFQQKSLLTTIHFVRPDLVPLPIDGTPIPKQLPPNHCSKRMTSLASV